MRGSFRTDCCRWLIVIGFLISTHGVWGQENLISIDSRDVEIREVLNHIEEQTGLVFSYNNRLFDDKERVSLNVEAVPLDEVLRILFSEMQIQHIIMERQIILKRERKALLRDRSTEESASVPRVRFTVSGYVKDAATGEVLIGATVALPDRSAGTITNAYGFFSLTLEEQHDSIECSYIGYNKVLRSLKNGNQRITFSLEEKRQSIGEVVVFSEEMRETI
ncbi:MAG: carboxypeptidase-like regulatory domain-containing protein, partial [Bacteroidales bacterium]|nr:carboxypeptidase-like regulatory domain-containing protein [Bacteroidales bacterium]